MRMVSEQTKKKKIVVKGYWLFGSPAKSINMAGREGNISIVSQLQVTGLPEMTPLCSTEVHVA